MCSRKYYKCTRSRKYIDGLFFKMFTNVSSSKNFIDFSMVVICVKGFSIYHSGFSNQLIVNCEQMLEELDEYRP